MHVTSIKRHVTKVQNHVDWIVSNRAMKTFAIQEVFAVATSSDKTKKSDPERAHRRAAPASV